MVSFEELVRLTVLNVLEYTQTVQKVYEQIECVDEIRNAFAQIQPLFQTIEGRGQLNSAFV